MNIITLLLNLIKYTVEPPIKGHIGGYINSVVLSFVERLSSFGGSKYIRTTCIYRANNFGTLTFVLFRILCPYLRGSTIGGSTVCVKSDNYNTNSFMRRISTALLAMAS